MARRKAQLGLSVTDGGALIPIGKNMFLAQGRTHAQGGIGLTFGKNYNPKGDLEIEKDELVQIVGGNNVKFNGNNKFKGGGQEASIRVFSSVPLLRGVSPAELVLQGYNPDDVFKAQEEFKDRNHINDDGTRYQTGGNKIININNLPSSFKGHYRNGRYLQIGIPPVANKANKLDVNFKQKMSALNDDMKDFIIGGIKYINNILPKPLRKYYTKGINILNSPGVEGITNADQKITQVQSIIDEKRCGGIKKFQYGGSGQDDTKTAALKRLRNRFTITGDYGGGLFGGAGAGSVIMEQPEYVNDTITKRYLVPVTQTFNDAFRNARNSGQNEFMFDGKLYNTNLGDNPNNNAAGASRTSTIIIPIEHKEVRRRKKEFGGNMIYEINGNVKNSLMSARPKAQYGKTVKINRDSYETVEEAVERYKQLYRIRYDKEPSKSDIDRVAWTKSLENAVNGDPNLITGYGPNVGVRGPNVTKIVSGANRGKQIARTQTTVRNRNVKSATPQRQAVNTKVSEAARAERQSQFDAWQQGEAFNASTMPIDAVAVNRPTIGTGVRSGRKNRVDDVIAIERSQRGVDPLSYKPKFGVYDKAYAKKVNGKMNQFANVLLGSGTGAVIVGNTLYDKEKLNSDNNLPINDSVNSNIIVQPDSTSTKKVNNKRTVNKNTNNTYVSTTRPNTGQSYVINPLTGEWIRNGIVETSEPSVKGTTKVSSRASSTPRRGETQSTATSRGIGTLVSEKPTTPNNPMEARYASRVQKGQSQEATKPNGNHQVTNEVTADQIRYTRSSNFGKSANQSQSSTGGQQQDKINERLIPQFKSVNTGDWIGLGSNLAGHIASYFINNNLLKNYPMPAKPIMAPAAKLKTRYNINPQLSENRETELVNRAAVRRNSQSSNTSLAREQRIINEARNNRNQLYGQKENIETQLINQDRLNRQTVAGRNVAAYNDWLNKTYVAKTNKILAKQHNLMNLINGIPNAVTNIIGNIDSRRNTNNTIKLLAAANPNVDGRLLGIGDYHIGEITKKRYDKFGNLING